MKLGNYISAATLIIAIVGSLAQGVALAADSRRTGDEPDLAATVKELQALLSRGAAAEAVRLGASAKSRTTGVETQQAYPKSFCCWPRAT